MAPGSGTRLGAYEIIALIGAGGMGEVYRARDSRLNREVALKVLPELFAADPDRLTRFKREAQLLASLNHPNIAAIYGFEENALAMELVDGPTLADRIAQGPLPLDEALPIARQIAEALEGAHERGIIHRDLKPANIKVRPDGTVKVLDFGLAKAFEGEVATPDVSHSPTLSVAATRLGVILGTAAYMAPEQAKGRAVDKRADIWAFGCVLYEMLTGARAFDGNDITDVLASVIKSDPEWAALPASVPPAVRTVIQHCLKKDAGQRFHDIGDVRLALSGAFHTESMAAAPAPSVTPRRRPAAVALLTAAAVVAASAIAASATWLLTRPAAPAVGRLAVLHSEAAVRFGGLGSDIVITPDGRRIAYLAGESEPRLYLRPLDQLNPTLLAPNISNPVGIFVSPDGQWIGFVDPADAVLKKVAVTGGPPLPLAKLSLNQGFSGATWLPDDSIVFGTNTGLMRVATGSEPAPITKTDQAKGEVAHRSPHALPGGDAVLFTIVNAEGQSDRMQIALLDLQTGQHQVIVRGGSSPLYSPSGHIVYGNSGTLHAVPFDLKRRAIRGNPVGVIEGVVTKASGVVSAHMAADGSLVYVAGTATTAQRSLVWVDRQGREEEIKVPPRTYAYARLSPDGRRIALDIRDEQRDIWTWDLARSTLTRLTFNPGIDRGPIWTADGTRLAVSTVTAGAETVFVQLADGSGTPTRVTPEKGVYFPMAFSPDGKYLLVGDSAFPPYDILMIDVEAKTEPKPLLNAAYSESNAVVSPDGRWMAYQSNESGKDEIYVRPFPNVNEGRWQVSTNTGTRPLWSRDGRELFYFIPPGVIMAAPIVPGAAFSAGTPVAVVKGNYSSPQSGRMYDVSPDGRRFLLIKEVRPQGEAAAPPPQLIVVQHWSEELKRLVP